MTGTDPSALDSLDSLDHALAVLPTVSPAAEQAAPERRAEADAIAEALTALAVALPQASPRPDLRARLLASASGPARFAPFIDRLARMIDVAADAARELLARIDRPESWSPSPAPNVLLVHLQGGPAVAHLDVGFVRVAAGTPFPQHRHIGDEHVLVLQGSYRDSTGPTVRTGDHAHMPSGSEHHYLAGPERDLIYVVVFGGIEIDGVPVDALRRPAP
jgi:quercetin dioxygenase-like cupin family protein